MCCSIKIVQIWLQSGATMNTQLLASVGCEKCFRFPLFLPIWVKQVVLRKITILRLHIQSFFDTTSYSLTHIHTPGGLQPTFADSPSSYSPFVISSSVMPYVSHTSLLSLLPAFNDNSVTSCNERVRNACVSSHISQVSYVRSNRMSNRFKKLIGLRTPQTIGEFISISCLSVSYWQPIRFIGWNLLISV